MTWALLVWWSAWSLGPLARVIASAFVTLTFLATLGFGEHYLVDLIVAVPLTLAIEGICARNRRAILTGFALTLGWIGLMRTSLAAELPAIAGWSLILATIALTGVVQIKLRPAVLDEKHRDLGQQVWKDGHFAPALQEDAALDNPPFDMRQPLKIVHGEEVDVR
jgi:hypothetical protein